MSATKHRSIVVLFVALTAAPAAAQEPIDPKFDRNPFDTDAGIGVMATLQCTGGSNAFGVLGARMLASEFALLPKWHFEFDKVIPLNPRNLSVIEDGRFLPDVRAKLIADEVKLPDRGFYFAYIEAQWRSHLATNEMFEKSAEENPNVPYSELASNPRLYRGKIITVKGQLTRLESRVAPERVQDAVGLDKIYYAEILVAGRGVPTFVAVFTDLPQDLAGPLKKDRSVTFRGYYLGNISFPTDQGAKKKSIARPYLVGRTMVVHDKADALPVEVESYSYTLIICAVGGIVGVVMIGAFLSLWFRRSDQKIRSQLANVRDKHVPFNLEPDSAPDAPVETGIKPGDPPQDPNRPAT